MKKNLIVAITGASGVIYGIRLLEMLRGLDIATHLIISKAGIITIKHETEYKIEDVKNLADFYYEEKDISACIASGSFLNEGMIIAPCSTHTMSAIAHALNDNLITRAADITLKERRKLILMFRETNYNLAHIKNMESITLMGGIISPPMPSLYNKPKNIDQMINYTIIRVLDHFGFKLDAARWQGLY